MACLIYMILAILLFILDRRVHGYYLLSVGIGAVLSSASSLLGFPLSLQLATLLVGAAVSIVLISLQLATLLVGAAVSIVLIRPVLVKTGRASRGYVSSLIGRTAELIDPIDRTGFGHVRIDGVRWSVVSLTGEEIERGEPVIIREISGATLYVEKNSEYQKAEG